jgi:hypothetical protein
MTPKEKAIQLVTKIGDTTDTTNTYNLGKKQCKKLATIVVDEIDKAIDFDWMEVQNLDRQHAYWQQVKQEIEQL